MIALAMIGILLAIIVPDMGKWKHYYTFRKNARDTISALKQARIQALNLHEPVLFSADGNGYTVAVDINDNRILEASDKVLLSDLYTQNVTISNSSFGDPILISFNNRGIPSPSGSFQLNVFQKGVLRTFKTVTLFTTGGCTIK